MSNLGPVAWNNGKLCDADAIGPSIASISLHMGTGVFDGMMAYPAGGGHRIFRGAEHFARFRSGSEKMGLNVNWTVEDLLDAAQKVVADQAGRTCYIRPIAYRGGPELWLTGSENRPTDISIFCVPLDSTSLDAPMTCEISPVRRISSAAIPIRWKVCGLYANSFLARKSAEAAGFDDGVMLDSQGFVTEASAANIFLLDPDQLVTPGLGTDVFPGITRGAIMEICRSLGLACLEEPVREQDLAGYDGAFLCSTLMEVRPITQLANRPLSTCSDPRYNAIVAEFKRLTRGQALNAS